MKPKSKILSRPALEVVAIRFRVLGDASRLLLLQHLFQGECTVQELCELTGMNQANVSKHLSLLAGQRIVVKRKQGLFTYYKIIDESIYELCDLVCGAVSKCYGRAIREFSGR